MKKRISNDKNKNDPRKNRNRLPKQKLTDVIKQMDEDDSEDFRERASLESEDIQPNITTNWSQAQDRSEDFINEKDPFIQELERHPKSLGIIGFKNDPEPHEKA